MALPAARYTLGSTTVLQNFPTAHKLLMFSPKITQAQGSHSGCEQALHPPRLCLQKPCRCVPACCLGEEGISLLCPLLSSSTTTVLKAKTFSFLFPVFFFLFFFLNLQETFIHVKLYRNNSLFTAPPKSLSVTTSHLCTAAGSVPIYFLLQKPAGGQAGATPGDRAQPRSGEPRTAPAAPQKTSSVSVQDSTALLYPLKSPPGQRSDAGNRGVGSRGRCWCWGQRPHSGFAQRHQETSSFRACSIENEGLDGPKEFTNPC